MSEATLPELAARVERLESIVGEIIEPLAEQDEDANDVRPFLSRCRAKDGRKEGAQ